MGSDEEVSGGFPRYLKLWYTAAIALFLLALVMDKAVVKRIGKGEETWFTGQGEPVYVHVLKTPRGPSTLEVNGAEKAVLVAVPWLNWCVYAVVVGAVGAHVLRRRAAGPGKDDIAAG